MTSFSIISNFPLYLDGIKEFINAAPDYFLRAEYDSVDDLIQADLSEDELIILDLDVYGKPAVEQVRIIRKSNPKQRILILSFFEKYNQIIELIREGINGLVLKSCQKDEFRLAISMAMKNEEYFSKCVVEIVINQTTIGNPVIKPMVEHSLFSVREMEIIKLICEQKTAKEIGKELFTSEKTVDFHRYKIIEKMKVKNIVGISLYAAKHGLVNIDELELSIANIVA